MPLISPAEAAHQALATAFCDVMPLRIGVAVSGGGDSMALLEVLRNWGKAELLVASLDHGLRPEARSEIALVSAYAKQHGLSHTVLDWRWDQQGNLQQAAREGRRAALRDWAVRCGLSHIALGHTADDQAETVLMRLARGSGVDGLSAMEKLRKEGDVTWLRPLLDVRRVDLRAYLKTAGLFWADDPSNEDTRFDRVKARQMMETLAPLGMNVPRLAQTADHMRQQRELADWAVTRAAADVRRLDQGDVVFDREALNALPIALQTRLLSDALGAVSSSPYRPRYKALLAALRSDAPTPLHGCLMLPRGGQLHITREWQAVRDLRCPVEGLWDQRWQLIPPPETPLRGLEIGALGEAGLAEIPEWRASARPRQSLMASPAVWQGNQLVAAPLAGLCNGWQARL